MVGHLPGGLTPRDVAPDECARCAKCDHDDVEFDQVVDWDMGVASCEGTCENCGARMEGKGRRRDPEGGVEDIEWAVSDNGCGHEEGDDDEREDESAEA